MHPLQLTASAEALSGMYAVLGRRRARILREEMREGSDTFLVGEGGNLERCVLAPCVPVHHVCRVLGWAIWSVRAATRVAECRDMCVWTDVFQPLNTLHLVSWFPGVVLPARRGVLRVGRRNAAAVQRSGIGLSTAQPLGAPAGV